MTGEFLIEAAPLYADRRDAGRALAAALEGERGPELVVVGLARGGVEIVAEVACALVAPLDLVAVRKVGHPWQPEYGIGAVTLGDGVYIRGPEGLSEEQLARPSRRRRRRRRSSTGGCMPSTLPSTSAIRQPSSSTTGLPPARQ